VPHGTWFLWVGRNRAQLSGEAGSSPGFTGNPLVSMPRASDSGDPGHASRNGVPDAAFRTANGVGIAMRSISELNPHGLLTHCVRFAPASYPANGNTRYRPARYGFDRAGLAPAGLQQEVSLTHRSFPSSALIPARSQSDPEPTLGGGYLMPNDSVHPPTTASAAPPLTVECKLTVGRRHYPRSSLNRSRLPKGSVISMTLAFHGAISTPGRM